MPVPVSSIPYPDMTARPTHFYRWCAYLPAVIIRLALTSFAAGTQYSDGVVGALVVHPSQTVVGWPEWDEDLLVQMADWYHLQHGTSGTFHEGMHFDSLLAWTIN